MADSEEQGQNKLPPIKDIVIPDTQTKSARIRWLGAMGYKAAEISNYLGIRYQMVRNILTTDPKRAAREDMPPLEVRYRDSVDDIQAIMDHTLEQSLLEGRKERKAEDKAVRIAGRNYDPSEGED